MSIGGIDVSRETDDVAPNSDDAVKVFVAGSILWRKVDNALELQGGATFEVCKTNDYILPDGGIDPTLLDPPECFDVVDNGPKDGNALDGVFLVSGLSLGRYTVQETIAPDGFVADPDTVTVDLIPGDTEASIDDAFVNSREVLKITGFGHERGCRHAYLGRRHRHDDLTVDLHNYGTADANLTTRRWLSRPTPPPAPSCAMAAPMPTRSIYRVRPYLPVAARAPSRWPATTPTSTTATPSRPHSL